MPLLPITRRSAPHSLARRASTSPGTLVDAGGAIDPVALQVPAGRVKLRYQESYRAFSGGEPGVGIDFDVPAQLRVGVTSPDGESLDIKGPGFRGMGASLQVGGNWSRALVGTVEIVRPGEYTITAGPELKDAVEPQILVGG